MKSIDRKYLLALRILEIDIFFKNKYNIQSKNITTIEGGLGELELKIYSIPEEVQFLFHQSEQILERIKSRYNRKEFDINDFRFVMNTVVYKHQNSIGAYTEEFWLKVNEEELPIKRKFNWLLKILNIGYLSLDIHKSKFYNGIQELLDSDIFNVVYDENIRKQINDLIEISNQRLIVILEKLVKKKKLNLKESSKIWEYKHDLNTYSSFYNIPNGLLKEFEILLSKN